MKLPPDTIDERRAHRKSPIIQPKRKSGEALAEGRAMVVLRPFRDGAVYRSRE
jgi:hypothetical protein